MKQVNYNAFGLCGLNCGKKITVASEYRGI
jgi:hypothetical protein